LLVEKDDSSRVLRSITPPSPTNSCLEHNEQILGLLLYLLA
jgi:hypothetical protein